MNMKQFLRDIAIISAGQGAPQGDSNYCDNGTPFIKAGNMEHLSSGGSLNEIQKVSETVAKSHKLKLYPKGTVLFAKSGMSCLKGYVYVLPREAYVVSHLACITPNEEISDYLRYYFEYHKPNQLVKDAAYPSISLSDIGALEIDIKDEQSRESIIETLKSAEKLIDLRKQELLALDDLIKARFVEMFGDPVINSKHLSTMPMTDVCEIIDGDRGKNYPTADEFTYDGYCLFLNAKNVTASGFNFDNCMFVSREKDKALKNGKLTRGDVVLTTRGTIGNLAFYTDEIPFENVRINSGMVILRMKQDIVDEIYFIEQFKMQLNDIKKKIASGSAQPQLPISTMNKIQVLAPNIDEQKVFAEFVKQIDKSKVVVQKALDEAQLLFDSLMQKYFG